MFRSFSVLVSVLSMAIVMLCGLPALAQDNAEEIIVRGTALPTSIGEDAYSVSTIDAARLASVASGRVEDALRDVAGLQQFRRTDARSANATSQGATLRGLGGNASSRALVVLDGVPESDPFGGWVTWPAFAANRISEIRVTRGGGSGAYGSGALSGTIEFESLRPGSVTSAELLYGSRDSLEANAVLGGNLGGGFGFISASYARGDGFIPIVAGQRGLADRAAPYEQASVAARAVMRLNGETELQANVLAFTDRRTRGTILSGNGGDGADASIRLVHEGRWGWKALAYVQARQFQSRFVAIDATRTTVTQTVDQFNVPSTGLGARFEVRPPLGEDVELRLGGDWRRTVGETKEFFIYVSGLPTRIRNAGGSADTLGGFAELSARLGDLTLTGGGRLDHWSLRNGRLVETQISSGAFIRNEIAPDRSGWEGTGRAGLAWNAGDLTLRGAAYIGWRLPTLNELYRPFRVGADATAANPALRPELMKGAELGFEWQTRLNEEKLDGEGATHFLAHTLFTASATLFTNRLTDAIANVSLGSGPGTFPGVGFVAAGGAYRQRLNVDAIQSRGIEIDLGLRRREWNGDPWFARLSYAYTDAHVRSSGLAIPLNGRRPAQVPSHMLSATAGWKGLSTTMRYVSSQFEDDQNVRRLRDALTLDAVARLPVTKHLNLIFRGENIANARVEAAISSAGIIERASPRTFWVGIEID